MKLSESIAVDDERDLVIAFGVTMTGDLLRVFLEPTPPDIWYRTVRREDGVIYLERAVLEMPRIASSAH